VGSPTSGFFVRFRSAIALSTVLVLAGCASDPDEVTTDPDPAVTAPGEDQVGETHSADLADGVAAEVGGVTIAVALIDARNQLLREDPQFGAQLEEDETGMLEGQLRSQILNQLVLQELVLQGAASDGIEVTDDDVAAERAVLVEEFGDEETLQAQLAAAGLPEDQLDMEIRASLAIDRVTDQLLADAGDLDPADQEARFAVQEQWLRSIADDVDVVVDTAFGAWSPEQLAVIPA
jgi:hypothetical protein